ncbi:DUF222 domain-containing protein [Granulicoccus phenolivorans]|uniref:DUF222 domain-containing protein n=1 Tax=Granulicoccus phenolivorans TaxID=266854 RepID=UPI000AB22723|nr:DUF222 domain-containing protein [Granulicoccus phenolivorans]
MGSITAPPGYAEAAAALRHVHEQESAIEVAKLIAVAAMCDRYRVDDSVIVAGCEETMVYGADGTPALGAFLSLEVAGILQISDKTAGTLIAETLNLRHRHPLLWEAVLAGRVRSWPARQVTWKTKELSAEKCRGLDRQLAAALAHQNPQRALRTVDRLVLAADPDRAREKADRAARARDVRVFGIIDGHTDVWGRLDPGDGVALDEALARIAAALPESDGDHGQRRAKALGWLARNANGETVPDHLPLGTPHPGIGDGRRFRRGRSAELVVHLTGTAGQSGVELSPVARVDGYGPVLTDQLGTVLAGCQVKVHPILDIADVVPVDGYQVPERMRRIQEARNPSCVFPFSGISSRYCDLDHTIPFDHQAPAGAGQTSLANTAPLSRKAHRAKTHAGWRLDQPEPGLYQWTSPAGFQYTVTPHGTIAHPAPTRDHQAAA